MRWLTAVCILGSLAACGRLGFDDRDLADATLGALTPLELVIPSFATTSPTFVPIPGGELVIPASPGRRWLLLISAGLHSTTLNDDGAEIRYLVDGIERGMGGSQNFEAGKAGPWQHVYAFDGASAPLTIHFELRELLGATGTVERLRAVALPLPEDAVSLYASADGIQPVTSTALIPVVTLMAEAPAGEYLCFAAANGSDAPDLSDVYLQWAGPDGTVRLRESQISRSSWQAVFAVWRETLAGPTATFTLSARVSSGMSQFRDARVFAVRTDAFPSIDFSFSEPLVATAAPAPLPVNDLIPAGTAAQFLYLASLRLAEVCAGLTVFADRRAHFVVDDVEHDRSSHVVGNCAYETTYGTVGLLRAPPARVATEVSSGNGLEVEARDSAILVLGLP